MIKTDETEKQAEMERRVEAMAKGEIHHVRRAADDKEGIQPGIFAENGNLILDFGKPIQYLGMTKDESQAFITGLMMAHMLATKESDEVPATLN